MVDESDLALSNIDFLRTFNQTDSAIFIKDLEHKFTFVNPACAETLGLSSPKGALGRTDRDFFEEELAAEWLAEETEVVETGKIRTRENEVPVAGGGAAERRIVETYKLPLRDSEGNIIGVFGMSFEVEGKRAELERYRLAAEGSSAGVWYRNIETGETWFSPRWKKMLGFEDDEFPNSADALWDQIHPEDVDRVRAVVADHLKGNTESYECEFQIRHANGSFRSVAARGKAKRDKNGKAIAFAGSHSDFTFYQSVIDTIPGFVFVKDRDCKFTYVNDSVAVAFGLAKQDLIGNTDHDLYDKHAGGGPNLEQVEKFADDDNRILCGLEAFIVRDESFGERENFRMLRTRKAPLFDHAGKIVGLVGVTADITELYEERALLKNLMDYAEDGIFFKDKNHRFTRVNRGLASIVGASPQEMIGMTDAEFFQKTDDSSEDYIKDALKDEIKIFETNKPLIKKELKTPTVNGFQWRQVTKVPVTDEKGDVVGLVGISRDITAARKDHEELERQKDLLENVLNALPQCIFIKDTSLAYVKCNQSWVDRRKRLMDTATEMTVGNVVGKTDYDFWPEAEAERLQRVDRAVISEGVERKRFRETQIMLDGTEATLETTKIPLRDMITGEVVSLLGIYEDVTDRLEEEAMEIRREHDRKIARSIGHCLKGWIAILEGTCLALTMEHNETPNIKRLNDGIAFLKHATKMATVHYALDAKKDPEEFSLNELLSSIVETIVDERISFHADGRSPIIQGQRFHLQNAFLEIIANARDFAPVPAHNGRIEISIEVCDKSVSIHVRDNGRGVPPHLKSSIFELFVTSSDVRTGMGLAYVKRIIVEIHNGNVEEIGTLGHGAHFVITLPLVEKTT